MKRSGFSAWLTYLTVRAALAIMWCFPINWNLRSARLFARLWIILLPRHRNRAIEHLTASFGQEYSSGEIARIADRSIENAAMFAVEAVCLPRLIDRFTWNRFIRGVNVQEALKSILSGRGAVLVTGHYGSFELPAQLLAVLKLEVTAVMRPLDNVYLNRFIVASRRRHGMRLLDKRGAAAHAEELLADGSLVGFVGDQDAGRKGIFVNFFGRPASTYKSIGLLAMTTKSPIVVAYCRRLGNVAQYEIGIQRVIHPHEWEDQADPLRWITQAYTTAIEQTVRDQPEQYLWIHRRWKSQPKERTSAAPATAEATSP